MSKSKRENLLARLGDFSTPIMWRDFRRLFENHLGFKMYAGRRGSGRAFIKGSVTLNVHQPHARDPWMTPESRKKALEAIAMAEAEEEEADEEPDE
jgi:hypothetical protein